MQVTEYNIERSDSVLTLRRTRAWLLGSLVGAMFPLAGIVLMGREFYLHPVDKFTLFLSLVVICGMLFVFYRLLIWGRCLIFDRKNNLLLIDGRKVCALSDLVSVQMEGSQRSPMMPRGGRLRGLHLKTAQGKDITLKYAWESNPEYARLTELVREIADFVGIRSSIA